VTGHLTNRPVKVVGAVASSLALWALLAAVLPHGAPAGILLAGAVFGAINALVAVSIVLVYRASRVVNFASAEFGAVAAVIAIELRVTEGMNYFLAIGVGLIVAAAIGGIVEVVVLRRFSNAPRLIVGVVTIGLAQVFNGISIVLPIVWNGGNNPDGFSTPWKSQFRVAPVTFDGNYLLAILVVPVLLGALAWFMRYSPYGIAIRAAADNGDRARLLAVPVRRLSTLVWAITGVLSATAVLLRVPILGFSSYGSVSAGGLPLLLATLTAAVVGSMTSLPVTVVAAIGIGIVEQLGAWTFRDSSVVQAALLVVILLVLLTRRNTLTRAADSGITTWQAIRPIRPIPPELANLRTVRWAQTGIVTALVALALLLPQVLAPSRTQLLTFIVIYAIVACSLVVLTGWAGHISLGHVAFMGFGGATTGLLFTRYHTDLLLSLAAGMVVAGVAALLIGLPALRISGPFLAVTTLAFAVTSANYFLVPKHFPWFVPTETFPPFRLFGRISLESDRAMYYLCLLVLVMVTAAVRGLRSAHAGRAIIAAKENRQATQSFGIDTTKMNLIAFVVSGMIAGLAGGLFVVQQRGFDFHAFNAEQGLQFFTMVVIGGLGSLSGAVLGAVYVYGVQYVLPPGWSVLATGVGLIALLMFLPGGLGDLMFRWRDSWLRWIAGRRRLHVPSLVADSLAPVMDVNLSSPAFAPEEVLAHVD
jgi:branched-chain amino acid transport system permease protein